LRNHPEDVGEVGVPGKDGGERMRVVRVPGANHRDDDFVRRLFGLQDG
jgi:hypothetical protein